MKSRPILTTFLVLLLSMAFAGADDLTDARARFDDGEYDQAVRLFEQYLEKAPPSAAVFFELGRALGKSGQEARAALNFRRALILDPRFAPARVALQEADTALGVPSPKQGWRPMVAERIPMDALALSGTLIFWVGLFAVLAAFLPSTLRRRRLVAGVLLLVISCGLFSLVGLCDPRVGSANTAVVLTNGGTALLSSPTDQAEKIASMPQGSLVEVLSQRGRWFYGQLPGGSKGWFLTEGIVPLIPPG